MSGVVYLVGIGPGNLQYIAPKAVNALKNAQSVLGHKSCLSLIRKYISGKEVVSEEMTPIERSGVAAEKALKGETVAIVSIGDPGIYAIASTFFQFLKEKGVSVAVKVVPGVAAANAAAALLGSPLGHDFATISLGDLATPWEVVEKRLEYAAKADFVVVLYNPLSREGDWRIKRAVDILMRYKGNATPVGIVTNAMRKGEKAQITTLGEVLNYKIVTETTVIIGNSETFVFGGRMVTPRRYETGLGY